MKRFFDILIASSALIILGPVILITYILVRLRLGAPAIFKQKRPGLYGRPFVIYKFRTMTDELNEKGELLPDHVRLTPLGEFLRKFSLDEFPQLINVIKGDLSLVGPRPLAMEYLPLYSPFQAKRHEVKPGMTGWAQVNGRNSISWEKKFELDVWYVENQSFLLDLKILALTIKKVISIEGINQDGHATMSDFKGTKQKS